MADDRMDSFRLFTLFWLFGWLVKAKFFGEYLFAVVCRAPWTFDFFPPFFQSSLTVRVFYLLPLVSAGVLLTRNAAFHRISAAAFVISSAVLAVHQDTHNDATFVTSFWTGLWAMWLVGRPSPVSGAAADRARALSAWIVGMIFAGGCVGKWTGGYWDGSVLENIFGTYEAGILAEFIKHRLPPDAQDASFRILSRLVVVCEGLLALAPLVSQTVLVYAGVPILLGFALTNTVSIYSVLACVIGMILAASRLGLASPKFRSKTGLRS